MLYIHERPDWPRLHWRDEQITQPLAAVRHRQGLLAGRMQALGCSLCNEAVLQTLTEDVLMSGTIEGQTHLMHRHLYAKFGELSLLFEHKPS